MPRNTPKKRNHKELLTFLDAPCGSILFLSFMFPQCPSARLNMRNGDITLAFCSGSSGKGKEHTCGGVVHIIVLIIVFVDFFRKASRLTLQLVTFPSSFWGFLWSLDDFGWVFSSFGFLHKRVPWAFRLEATARGGWSLAGEGCQRRSSRNHSLGCVKSIGSNMAFVSILSYISSYFCWPLVSTNGAAGSHGAIGEALENELDSEGHRRDRRKVFRVGMVRPERPRFWNSKETKMIE